MARKGKKRSIHVLGCDLDDGIVSVIVNGDHAVTVTDTKHVEKLVEDARWVSNVPRQN